MLVKGEAGVGKTSLVEQVVGSTEVPLFRGSPGPGAVAYGPIVAALREYGRTVPGGLSACGPLQSHLALLLPELGDAVTESDQPTLFEAIRCALVAVAAESPAALLLDDLQRSDATTLDLLSALATSLGDLRILIVAVYRSEEIPQGHAVRRLGNELRRRDALRELTLEPLSEAGTAELAAEVLGTTPSPVSRAPSTSARTEPRSSWRNWRPPSNRVAASR